MNAHPKPSSYVSTGQKISAAVALIFGVMTLFSAGSVLFGPAVSRELAGAFVDFVVWFNFAAGILYIAAAIGIWRNFGWAFGLSMLIAVATGLMAIPFALHVIGGEPFEMRTVGALAFRFGFWAFIAIALRRWRHRA